MEPWAELWQGCPCPSPFLPTRVVGTLNQNVGIVFVSSLSFRFTEAVKAKLGDYWRQQSWFDSILRSGNRNPTRFIDYMYCWTCQKVLGALRVMRPLKPAKWSFISTRRRHRDRPPCLDLTAGFVSPISYESQFNRSQNGTNIPH